MLRHRIFYHIAGLAWALCLLCPSAAGAAGWPEQTDSVLPAVAAVRLAADTTKYAALATDSILAVKARAALATDTAARAAADTVDMPPLVMPDSAAATAVEVPAERWMPDPKRAMWLAIIFPGGGQIYNRKYWKLPIFYGGFIGCYYALSWNNTMYHDYAQAYIDIMDDDPNTKSYESFLPPSYDVDANLERLQKLFKRKKDYYRRYRDMSMFFMMGIYALSVIDAYVDAELSSFDISRDLSMKVRPAVINQSPLAQRAAVPATGTSYGLSCSLSF